MDTLPCFWCSEDAETPVLISEFTYEPCFTCSREWMAGVVLLEIRSEPCFPSQPSYSDQYPTGRWIVVDAAGVPEIFAPGAAEVVLKTKMGFLTEEIWSLLGLDMENGQI